MRTSGVVAPEITVHGTLLEKVKSQRKLLVVHTTLKFSCLIAKYFKAEIAEKAPQDAIPFEVNGVRVYVKFRAVGAKFCSKDIGFQEFEFPLKEPERFFPKWITVNADLSGEFGYA